MANRPPSENPLPLAQTSGYATDCGGRHFSTRPGAALSHVGSLSSASTAYSVFFRHMVWYGPTSETARMQ